MSRPLFSCPYFIAVKCKGPISTPTMSHVQQIKSEAGQHDSSVEKDDSDSSNSDSSVSMTDDGNDGANNIWASLSSLKALFEYANLFITFQGSVTVCVFAPTNSCLFYTYWVFIVIIIIIIAIFGIDN